MSKSKDYNAGYYWGKKAIKENYREHGNKGLVACDKAAKTCRRYASDTRLKKTKKGKPLTAPLREYYKGISDGMQDGYNSL